MSIVSHPKIRKIGDPILRVKCEPVSIIDSELEKLVEEMKVVMAEAKGLGLAANQIGVPKAVFTMNCRGSVEVFLNPEIVSQSDLQVFLQEGCLSIPGIPGQATKRYNKVVIKYNKLSDIGETIEEELVGTPAIVVQHEVDHLNGKLFVDQYGPLKKSMVMDKYKKYLNRR
jgi:peptide deformylase